MALLLALSGCGNSGGGGYVPTTYNVDGAADVVAADAGAEVVSAADAGPVDAGLKDAGPKDTGPVDAGGGGPESCQGKCLSAFQPGLPCQCNDQCEKYGNCCSDWPALCKPKLSSCVGRCGAGFNDELPCQCSWACAKSGSCCTDYLPVCEAKKDLDWLHAVAGECDYQGAWHGFKSAKDGDTIVLNTGKIVRFLVVNTPEMSSADCYAKNANDFTWQLMKKVGVVCLVKDPNQPDKDQYDRLLRYVYYREPALGNKVVQLNARLVRLGLGRVFYPWASGNLYEKISVLMQQKARQAKIGGWSLCGW